MYKHNFDDKDNDKVAFIHFSPEMDVQLECVHTLLINRSKFVGEVNVPTFQNMTICVYLKDVLPPERSLETWDVLRSVKFPSKYYGTPYDILRLSNRERERE